MKAIDPTKRYREKGKHSRQLLVPKRPARSKVRPDAWVFLNQATQQTQCFGPEQVVVVKQRSRKESGNG